MSDLFKQIRSPRSEVFRRAYIKRRSVTTGLYESDWFEVTSYVKKWGKISQKVDDLRLNKFTFANIKMVFDNNQGYFNPHDDQASFWYGYLNQQRTLIKIEGGFITAEDDGSGVDRVQTFPSTPYWDQAYWDEERWGSNATMFTGIISGDIYLSGKNEVTINVKPLTSVFQEFPARNLTGWTSSGFTAEAFVQMVMGQTDGSSNFYFLPFFGDTTSGYTIQSTTNIYLDLNTSGADGVYDKNVWEIIEKLAEAENFIPYVNRQGVFNFVSREPGTDVIFEMHGVGSFNSFYGTTIKEISSYGYKISKYYSRVEVKFVDSDTVTSYLWKEADYAVDVASNSWILGLKTFKIENFYIPNTTTADAIATSVFNELSALKKEIEFTTSFIPNLDILDRISIHYDPNTLYLNSLWDQNDWAADSTNTSSDLVWDASTGDAIRLNGDEFKFLSLEIDLDRFECKYLAREI